jgi:hypothetical protein
VTRWAMTETEMKSKLKWVKDCEIDGMSGREKYKCCVGSGGEARRGDHVSALIRGEMSLWISSV